MSYTGHWSYHPLVVSVAETNEVLWRAGNRPSHEGAAEVLDRAIELVRVARPTTIVGVLHRDLRPPEAFFPSDEAPEFWFPLQSDHRRYNRRDIPRLYVLGRIAAELAVEFPEGNVLSSRTAPISASA